MHTGYTYLTLAELREMDKSEEVGVRTLILYAHLARINSNPTQNQAVKVLRKSISCASDKNYVDSMFVKMCADEVLLVFENYFEDYKCWIIKLNK